MKLLYRTTDLKIVIDLISDYSPQLRIGQRTCSLCSDLLFASYESASSFISLVMYERKVSLHEILSSLHLRNIAALL
jgi:hypothetical protein